MRFFLLRPEVAGSLGPSTIIDDRRFLPEGSLPTVSFLEYCFEGWLGDELLTMYPVFVVTEGLGESLIESKLQGISFDKVKISRSEEFCDRCPDIVLPQFRRLLPEGRVRLENKMVATGWSGLDFNLSQRAELVVTSRALEVLRRHRLEQCEIEELKESR